MECFISEKKIKEALSKAKNASKEKVKEVIETSLLLKGLSVEETAILLECNDNNLVQEMFNAAGKIKNAIYGKRLVLFAPLYISNYCTNNCLYCGFRKDNKELKRRKLSIEEIKKEVEILEADGHKRILLVAGSGPDADIDFLEKAIKEIYKTKSKKGEIRRVNVNVAPMPVEDFRRLKKAGIGTYQVFQETYHKETYKKMHPCGAKKDYYWRLLAPDRAMEAGIDDIGVGALFGLYDYKFEVLALLQHCLHLEEVFKVGPHTISVPRIKPALNAPASNNVPYPVSDEEFKKIIAIIRMAVPYTGMILTTRESANLRNSAFKLGISQVSAGSRTNPGGYSESNEEAGQFSLDDARTMKDVIKDISRAGFYPSFCTSCYRLGRTGDKFMEFAKTGKIQEFCLPNSILTYKEYLLDYGDDELKKIGDKVIEEEIKAIKDKNIQQNTRAKLKELETGKRDLYF